MPGQANALSLGVNNDAARKSSNYARVSKPLFDDQPTAAIGALAVAAANPSILYVGSGEGLQ